MLRKLYRLWQSSKTLPDVMYHLPATIFDMADKGLIEDLSPYMDEELKKTCIRLCLKLVNIMESNI